MFRAATNPSITKTAAPPVFTGTNLIAASTSGPSRNLDRGHSTFGLHIRHASVDQLHRAQASRDPQRASGAVTFPATRPPNSRAWPPGFIASTEGRKND